MKNRTAHTPGPWIVEKSRATLFIGTRSSSNKKEVDFTVASIAIESLKAKERKQAIADASLMAAAPELLRSLEGCLAVLKDELAGIIESSCLDDENGVPIRSTLDELAREDVEDFEGVVADVEAVIRQAKGRKA